MRICVMTQNNYCVWSDFKKINFHFISSKQILNHILCLNLWYISKEAKIVFIVLCWDNQKLLLDAVGLIFDPFRAVFQLSLCWYPSNENWPFVKGLQFWPQNVSKNVVSVNQMKIYFLVVISNPIFFLWNRTYLRILAFIFYT